jgi:hypothetical protein
MVVAAGEFRARVTGKPHDDPRQGHVRTSFRRSPFPPGGVARIDEKISNSND